VFAYSIYPATAMQSTNYKTATEPFGAFSCGSPGVWPVLKAATFLQWALT